MRIRDYLNLDAEAVAELKATTTFHQQIGNRKASHTERLSPPQRAVMEGVLSAKKRSEKGPLRFPALAQILLSNVCNHGCPGCPFGTQCKKDHAFMAPDHFAALLDALVSLKVRLIEISGGGEPTLHPDFKGFARSCVNKGFRLGMLTTGAWREAGTLKLVVEVFSSLQISLDASNHQVYNRVHHPPGPGEFQKVLENIEAVARKRETENPKLVLGAEVRLRQTNMNFIEEITLLARDLGMDYARFRAARTGPDCLLAEQAARAKRLIEELKTRHDTFPLYEDIRDDRAQRRCEFSRLLLVITPAGDAYACPHLFRRPKIASFGNLFADNPEKIWFGAERARTIQFLGERPCRIDECRWRSCNDLL
jgi:MoaA/NifB/PqqE/SkfB family radical SAM enzyme